jgi:uncharacterized membrane protein
MFCKVCGKELKENEKFCTQCGTKVQNEQPKKPEKKEEKKPEKKGMSCLGVGLLTGGVLAVPVLLGILAILVVVVLVVIFIFVGVNKTTKVNTPDSITSQVIEEIEKEEDTEYEELEENEELIQSNKYFEDEDYVLPESEYSYISESDLYGFTEEECRIARNEIYARHGRMFKDAELQAYFNEKSWYTPTIPADAFQESMLNEYEKANKDVILEYERARGWN